MVKGLNLFRDRFRQFEGSFTLIGGAASRIITIQRRFHSWQVRNFTAKSKTVRFFMGHLLTRSLMVGPGGSSCATMRSAARQPAGQTWLRRFNSAFASWIVQELPFTLRMFFGNSFIDRRIRTKNHLWPTFLPPWRVST